MSKKIQLTMKSGKVEQVVEGWSQEALKSVYEKMRELTFIQTYRTRWYRRDLINMGAKVIVRNEGEIVEVHFKDVTFVVKSYSLISREKDEVAKVEVESFLTRAICATPAQFAELMVKFFKREELFVRLIEAAEARCFKVVCKFDKGEFCFGNPMKDGVGLRRIPMEIKVASSFDEIFAA